MAIGPCVRPHRCVELIAGAAIFSPGVAVQVGLELPASSAAVEESRVRVISAPAYHFNSPDALALRGDDLFVPNDSGGYANLGSVTALPAAP